MTRKHFQQIAETVKALPADVRKAHAEKMAETCAKSNKNFDRARFLAACGV